MTSLTAPSSPTSVADVTIEACLPADAIQHASGTHLDVETNPQVPALTSDNTPSTHSPDGMWVELAELERKAELEGDL